MNIKDSTLIVAHPDDEILFSASILASVRRVIICFGLSPNQAEEISLFSRLNSGRLKLIENFPLKNVEFLMIPESPRAYTLKPILFPEETIFGIKNGSCSKISYESNFYEIIKKLEKYLKDAKNLITHNPWGEYGHPEHIQVHRAVVFLANKYNLEVFVNGYFSKLSRNFMYKTIHRLDSKPFFEYTNKDYFIRLRNYYLQMDSWTWDKEYLPPELEVFYKLNNYKFDMKTPKFNSKDLRAAKLPLNLINFHSHRLPVRYFSLIAPRFIYIFVFRIILNVKYRLFGLIKLFFH